MPQVVVILVAAADEHVPAFGSLQPPRIQAGGGRPDFALHGGDALRIDLPGSDGFSQHRGVFEKADSRSRSRTEYVRKPRGGKPGLAACEREKTVMVRPVEPTSTDLSDAPESAD